MSFDHIPFPLMVERGTSSLEFNTTIIPTGSGSEQRIGNWLDARVVFNASMGVRSRQDIVTLVKFFRARKGRLRGFLVKDLLDYSAVGEPIGTGNGTNRVFQLQRVYSDYNVSGSSPHGSDVYGITGNTDNRPIFKPIAGTVNLYKGVTLQVQGGYGGYATANLTKDALGSIAVTNGGVGYSSVPSVTITGGGSGATATAVLTGTTVTSVIITNGGSGYSAAPTIAFIGAGTGATGVATLSNRISSLTLTGAGISYSTAPSVVVTSTTGSGAVITSSVTAGKLTGFTISNGGFGYTSIPNISILSTNGDYALDYKTGIVTFTTAPTNSTIVTWTGEFYIPCRFSEDSLPADEIFYDLFTNLNHTVAAGGVPDILLLETRDYL